MIFACVARGAALTVPLMRVDRPGHERHSYGNSDHFMPPLLAHGTHAAQGDFLVAPGDVRGLVVDRRTSRWRVLRCGRS